MTKQVFNFDDLRAEAACPEGRKFHPETGTVFGDEYGTIFDITAFGDADAVGYFLLWLDERRKAQRRELDEYWRNKNARARRRQMKLV